MFTLDGVVLRGAPITLARLYCGCVKTYAGHETQVDDLALCPEPEACTEHQNGVTAVESAIPTYLVG
jgi:hypothetical protein